MLRSALIRVFLLFAFYLVLFGCSAATLPPAAPTFTVRTPTMPAPTRPLRNPPLALSIPTSESDADPTATLAPSKTSAAPQTPAPTKTPPPTPTPLNPLMISVQRARAYPGSEIKIEQTLAPGANYNRYLASYLSDGLKINALLTVPRGEKPATGFPVIIFNHGYISPSVYRTTERYVDYVDRIARSGYIVFKSDYRGHGSSEGEARGGYGSPDYTIDVLNALGTMKKYPDADPNRIGMWGHSMGGYITLRAMVIDPSIKAGVIWGGVVASYPDLLSRWRRPSSGPTRVPPPGVTSGRRWRDELIEQYGTPEQNPEFWGAISANSYLAEVSAPIQLHHGTADTSVPLLFSELLYEQIQAVDGVVELYKYPGDNHNISKSFGTAMQRTIQFFDKYVKGS